MSHDSSSFHHPSIRSASGARAGTKPHRYQSLKIATPSQTLSPQRSTPDEIGHQSSVRYEVGQNGQIFGLVVPNGNNHPHVHVHADALSGSRHGHREELAPPTRTLRLPR